MPAHEEEGGVLGPHHFGKRDRYGPKQNLCRAGVAGTDLPVGVAAVPGVGVVLPQVRQRLCECHRPLTPAVGKRGRVGLVKSLPFIVDVDASGDGLGAVLSQREGKAERVVAYASRTLTKAERRYCATRREMLSFVWAVREFRSYLYGSRGADCPVAGESSGARLRSGTLIRTSARQRRHAIPDQLYSVWTAGVAQSFKNQLLAAQQADSEIQLLRQWLVSACWPLECPTEFSRDMHMLWQQRRSWVDEDSLIWRHGRGLSADCGISSAACWHGHSCAAGKDPRGNRCVLVLMDYFTKWTAVFSLANMEARTVAKVLDEEYIAYFGAPDYLLCDQGRSFEASVVLQICRLFDIKTPTFPYHPQRNGQAERFNRTLLGMLSILVNGNSGYWDNMLPFVMLAYNSSVHESTVVTPAIAMLGRDLRLPLYVQIENPPGREDQGLPDNIRGTRERIDRVHDLAMDHMKTQQRRQKCLHDRHAKE
ncbi:Gypsy retrotransposon integrase-like protein 1 [Trichinella patagoniensis]|uniref:Gypsy retrotransposon integrase-like protein 1 n=1 Tax=Trichinella patagoniensis TaxID=990121 RepID=A0A0V0Z2N9_9BILA|nr:Gypsy retrotransposon integrase-like protein 1 [Trichinella patagoniensis]